MNPGVFAITGPVVYVPVRHHSPACAAVVRRLVRELRPRAILIEGPSDFNGRLDELLLPHTLPIAIYSYVALSDGTRRGAFYPFCLYSPEWQALMAARDSGAEARFIDLPWSAIAADATVTSAPPPGHRYADGELRRGAYVAALCERLGVDDFDALWDTLFEIEPDPDPAAFLRRCHHFCYHARVANGHVPATDLRREAFMAAAIRRELEKAAGPTEEGAAGPILVVTGGFHSYALYARVAGLPSPDHDASLSEHGDGTERDDEQGEGRNQRPRGEWTESSIPTDGDKPTDAGSPASVAIDSEAGVLTGGVSLTPYSYQRLDGLAGYDAGMPNPGFYHRVWQDRSAGADDASTGRNAAHTYRPLLAAAATALRTRGQVVSSADLIAVETVARGLAALRGHAVVWRRDLIDAVIGALVKDELGAGLHHPMLTALHDVLRGREQGLLAVGANLPPLVHDIRRLLRAHDLEPGPDERVVELALPAPSDLARSRVLHQLRVLGIPGFARTGGTDLARRDDLARLWERWTLHWGPEPDAACIEAAVYGPSLRDAAEARLLERASGLERDAVVAALLLLDACLMGLGTMPTIPGGQAAALWERLSGSSGRTATS